MIRVLLIMTCWTYVCAGVFAQNEVEAEFAKILINGELVPYTVVEGDTLLLADLDDVSVSSPRSFKDIDERRKFLKYKRYANVVYPYAVKAIKIFRETEEVTRTMKKRKRQKHIKRLQKEMEDELKEPLKKLTKTQGYILIKMIEKELDTPFYDLVRNLRGSFVAGYWNQLGRLNGYRIKDGYIEGEDRILDIILHDYDVSHDYK